MSFYVVVYTAAHLVGAVSAPLDLDTCAATTDHWTERNAANGEHYIFACEEHDKRPKRQTKMSVEDRRFYESYCVSHGLGCEDLPNGDRVYPGYHCTTTYRNDKIIHDTCGVEATIRQMPRKDHETYNRWLEQFRKENR